jgi:peptidoglycan/LPS O-acetylase OafA/YrhL
MRSNNNHSVTGKRLQMVDLVRAFSILAVLAHHLGCYYISSPSRCSSLAYLWFRFMINGAFGVTIFFVVSGFVITRLIASNPGGLFNPDFSEFYTRRVARILPLLIFVCLLGIIFIIFFSSGSHAFELVFKNPDTPITPAFWVSIATFTFNWYQIFSTHLHENNNIGLQWGLLWSLAIEEQFYLFYPFVLKRLQNKRNLISFLSALIILGPIFADLFGRFFPNHLSLEKNSFSNFSFIAIGSLLYLVSIQYEGFLSKNKIKCVLFCFFGLFLFGIFYWHQYVSVNYWWFFWGPVFWEPWTSTFLAFGMFFFLLGGLHLDFFNSKYWSIFGWVGKLSYGGYLYHVLVLYLLWPYLTGRNEWLDFFTFAAITFVLAELSYRYFEVPANSWIRKTLERNKKRITQ